MIPTITAIVLTKNEEHMIANCIETLRWCSDIIVLDDHSDDATAGVAQKMGAKVFTTQQTTFAQKRNEALQYTASDWVFYIDSDERVTPQLAREIQVHVETAHANALSIRRENMLYGRVFTHGGWSETVTRVFRRSTLEGWHGDIHESPTYTGETIVLHTPLLHFTHRNTLDGLRKTLSWTPIEARLLFEANSAPVTIKTLFRKGFMEFFRRAVIKKGFKDGQEGWIESLIQGINRVLVYVQLWEMQQKPSVSEKYHDKELDVARLWKQKV